MSAKKLQPVVTVILDKSGSMQGVCQATIDGFNEYVRGLKGDMPDAMLGLTLFNHGVEPHEAEQVKNVEPLTPLTYRPSGSTSLYDAVCSTLTSLKDKVAKDQKSLVVIITDGEENTSTKYTEKHLANLVKELEARGNWTFVFLGANQDAFATASSWGVHKGNTANFNASGAGLGATWQAMSVSTGSMLRGQSLNTKAYFSKDQQDQLKNTK